MSSIYSSDKMSEYYMADIGSAMISAFLVTPFIKIVDQTVTQKVFRKTIHRILFQMTHFL